MTPVEAAPPPTRTRRPWWIPHFLGPVPDVGEPQLRLLGTVSLALLFEEYDLAGAFQFTRYFTQTVHGWSPGQYAAMVVFGGAVGIGGNIAAGRVADHFGRHSVGLALLGSFPFCVAQMKPEVSTPFGDRLGDRPYATQTMVRPRMRALASAILLFYGIEAVRYALLFTVVGGALWATLHYV